METETLMMRTGVRSEVYEQTHLEVMVDDMTSDYNGGLSSQTTAAVGGNGEVKLQDNGNKGSSGALPIDPVSMMHTQGRWLVLPTHQPETDQKEKSSPNYNSLPISDPLYFNSSNSSLYTPNGPVGITISASGKVQEIYLKKMFLMPQNHEFYCPSCRVCVDKVLFCETGNFNNGSDSNPIKPSSPVSRPEPPTTPDELPPFNEPVRCSECFSYLIEKGKDFFRGFVSPIPGPSNTPDPVTQPRNGRAESSKGWEILKSIVYGGLGQLLASLSVVTSAASADATTLNIVSLGIANLIGGLFVLSHNIRDLKASKPTEGGNETEAAEDKYHELLGRRENYFLHAFFAILSFLIFGLVPPIVYGFAFQESNDKDLKLAAVAGASVICITLLATAKAYTERPNNYMTYFKTITFYVTSGVLAALLTYLAGDLVKRLMEQLGWSEGGSGPNSILSLPEISLEKPGLGSY
ncbi:membrane protein of ER body 2-like [Lotus japonicus]|uniref:membrane protein of ER body 2-like n=1 Tax=Lotus japonicus TaxID=34305 RepID=UPI0025833E78|nr:membrane protein of ER body 2-like [Lotus japonicus]